jgi:hypothetical protein
VLTIYTGENGEGMFFENKAKPIDTEKELKNMHENGARYHPGETGTKKSMYNKQNKVLKRYKDRYGKYLCFLMPSPPFITVKSSFLIISTSSTSVNFSLE